MKTQLKKVNFTGIIAMVVFTTIMVFALVSSVNAKSYHFTSEEELQIEEWMVNETYWSMDEKNVESGSLSVENWMYNDRFWKM